LADFTLPELGEQIEAGDVLRVLVKAGLAFEREVMQWDMPRLLFRTD